MNPALLVPSVRPIATPSATTYTGNTTQLVLRQYQINGGFVDSNVGVVWSSANPAIASVSASGLVSAIAIGSVVITGTLGGASGTITITVGAADISSFVTAFNALGAGQITHGVYAGKGHTTSAGQKTTITDFVGSGFNLAVGPTGAGGFNYTPTTNLWDTVSLAQSMNTGQLAFFDHANANRKFLILFFQINPQPPGTASYQWGMLNAAAGQVGRFTAPSGGFTELFDGRMIGWGSDATLKGLVEMQLDDTMHMVVLEFHQWTGVLFSPGQVFSGVRMFWDRDWMAAVRGTEFTDATMEVVLGQQPAAGDAPGAWKWRAALAGSGALANAQLDALAAYARAQESVPVPKDIPLVVLSGNSWIAGVNVTTSGLMSRLWYNFAHRANFVNCGISGGTGPSIQDHIPVSEAGVLGISTRTKRIASYLEGINGLSGVGTAAATFNQDKAAMDALLAAGATHLIAWTMPYKNGTVEADRVTYNTSIRNYVTSLGSRGFLCDLGADAHYGASGYVGDPTYDDGTQHPPQGGYDYIVDQVFGPALARAIAA